MQLFFHEHTSDDQFTLDSEESKHLIKVLRKTQGDRVKFTNGKGCLFHCVILDSNPKSAKIKIEEREFLPEDDYYIHLAISPTKNSERMEWMVEKLTEIGVHEITFMESKYSERSHLKLERLEKKIIAACKQSLKTRVPKLNPVRPMNELVQDSKFNTYQRFIAYVDKENDRHLFDKVKPDNAYLILIGPEGDFSQQELQLAFGNHFLPCSLGKSRLRSETAGVAAVHTIQLKNNLKEL
ncbi:RNA methyltransferase, RsmE family [Belliella baltica DSM 15883]|uniref:Ribosomal RNA small subunit methyltransferase E n=1 Tax=Belliella baltica (strain DSM 15883 / CIP 108006 / LMG 21964 / BA134) TaxID=866536 RepID=I3Z9S8_BELBD|nr:16S rRNA (uracil(1498)-N(3))-methyltransferase [Belliella baltica]AFL85996.1 RNA methyltransferase, RsmE family [Belliella baltica DSM 15883]